MVSRYGVSKEGAVGVAVGALGPMHCLMPHCGGPHRHHHLTASHPQNPQPGHNHRAHPGHQPPPPPSPSPHLNQLTHPQLTVNVSHLGHHHHQHPHQQQPQQQQQQPPQQQQQTQMPPQYRVAANRSEFHGNYSAQPGGQVGGNAASNVGVPTGRGPPPLGGIQTIGQSTAGIPPGGPAGGQVPSQAPTPGVQSQPPQGPAPTTTPPVHAPSPQEMGKQAHLQTQPPSLQQVYVPTQNRPASQGYYQTGPRPQQPRGIGHRGGQGASGTPVVGMAGVGGGGGQPPAIYPHPASLPVQASAMYIGQSQVHGLHAGPHQQSVYPINNQLPIHQFSGPPQRHQPHQNQSYFPFQPPIQLPNVFGYAHAPAPQHGYYYTASNTMSLTRASTSAVSGGAQHVAGPLAGTQAGAPVVPQGTLQQPTQQAQPLPSMGIPMSQADVFSGHNGGATNTNGTTRSRKPRGQNAILDIVNPLTGKNISDEIYKDNETTQSGESSNRETPQPQNNGAEVIADFAARVAKAATEGSDAVPTSASETAPNTIQTTAQTSLSNIETNPANDANSQCSNSPPVTKNIGVSAGAGAGKTVPPTISSQSLGTSSNMTQIDPNATKTESKALQLPVKEFQPRSETKSATIEESSPVVSPVAANKDTVSVQLTASTPNTETTAVTVTATATATATTTATMTVTAETETEAARVTGAVAAAVVGTGPGPEATKHLNSSPNVVQTPITPYWSNVTQEIPKPSAIASSANPVPTREPFPNLTKTSSNSPPRRKPNATELPSNTKEQKERKTREKSLGSRGATPTPVHNQAVDHHHRKTNGDAVGDKTETEVVHPRNETQQKSSDGKAMQKQKSKNKLKPRELNRKGAEKEGTDMDAFVNTVSAAKTVENKQDNKEQHAPASKDGNEEPGREISKDIKEKDNYESKKEKEKEILLVRAKTEKHASTEVSKDSAPAQQASRVVDKPPASKESSVKSEDGAFNALPIASPNDVVDHAAVIEEMHLEALVAQKNEENFKVSALHASNDENATTVPSVITEKKREAEVSSGSGNAPAEIAAPSGNKAPLLKYSYKEGQWSPVNVTGRKSYDRDFLLRLQFDPNSKLKPANLPNLQAVLKDSLQNTHNTMDLRAFKDANIPRHDALMPGFAKTNMSTRPPPTSRKSDRGKPKANKPNVIHVSLSLREDVKLRETENAWKPTRLKQLGLTEEEAKTEALYKRVRSVLNKLTPQKFNTLVEQVRHLPIDTQERLNGVINLVFEKAVDEPSFSVEYALLCKELGMMEVAGPDTQDSSVSFKKLIITRCQKEFEKNPIDDVARNRRLKEIDECNDPEKKKELQLALEEEERRIRIKSVGNIRFIGELYKQQILTTKIMHRCIRHLLEQNDEDNLECLCKLLTTIGKDLELKGPAEEMQDYFNRMQEIVARKGHSKISSRIRFMLQDVIDLRANKWIPRRNDNNPKTIDQIQKEAESERLDMQVHANSAPLNTARKDDRNNDRKRNRGLGGPTDDGWSQPVGRVRPVTYSVETAKLKNKPPPMDDMQLGNRASYLWRATNPANNSKTISSNKFACLENMSNLDQDKRMPPLPLSGSRSTGPRECSRDYKSYDGRSSRNGTHQSGSASSRENHPLLDNSQRNVSMLPPVLKSASQSGAISHKAPMSEQEFTKAYNSILKHYLEEPIVENTGLEIQQKFDNATFAKLTRECINHVLEKSPVERELVSKLLSHLLRQNILPVECFKNGLGEVLEIVDDLVIDIPKIWTYLAEILSHSIEDGAILLSEFKSICISLRRQGFVGKFLGELMTKVSRNKGPKWLADKWDQSGLQLSNLIDPERENVDKIIQEYNLEFLTGDYNSAKDSAATEQLSFEKIQENLTRLMKENTSFDEICSWITANVGSREKDPQFIRHLMTAILETTLERHHGTWKLNLDTFANLQTLIQRYADANDLLELQCLYAIQRYIKKIEFPPGTLVPIMNRLWMDNVISSDAFLTWKQKVPEGPDVEGHSVSVVALTSFFTDLQEPDDNSSVEELSTSANQGC